MKIFIFNLLERTRLWTLKWAGSKHSAAALFVLAFMEASFFPIPPDVLLIGILAVNARKWWYYALIATIGSALGGAFGYLIGWGLYEGIGARIVEFYNLTSTVEAIGHKYSENVFLTVFTAAFTPIPFKVITIAAGLFKINIWAMIISALAGRALRFFMIASILKIFGNRINGMVLKYFNILSLAAIILVVLSFVAIKFLF
ncbi:MAG: cytochrome B [Candidatus Terrybacteria bacterium CG10_big_fil_rev_8_21_14_0_10_41_10]|uniref:Cytochrome B n=1 Tax=Candidatus Terrybacteria bacterium CG10_big_fil_rev_8_21_14_0_10_41_10 TaxID=1975026 RepID=A0A2M8LA00_9BACT|nr:MAG: cytochrome B [Candidatus Terrybacteria bacterium CG10_big_fil_rev_8_21_14_0_10_41_10]